MNTEAAYEFEWDDAKAASNLAKHDVDFNEAMEVFLDPLMMTRYDTAHSEDEERWVSLGRSKAGRLLLVVHTFHASSTHTALVRIVSARSPTKREREQYEGTH
jgi:uncharacterized DUF497 family protein